MSKSKERLLYEEGYKKPYPTVKREFLLDTKMPHVANNAQIVEIGLQKAGIIERDGERYEFQDLRVLFRVPEEEKN